MKFSVVIPLYNKGNHVIDTINSVLMQTFTEFELIVVDDGSTDNSLDIVKQIKDKRIKVFEQSNSGVSVARNTGIQKSTGEYICFLDADDYWENNYLETINRLTDKYPTCDMYVTAYKILLPNSKINYSRKDFEKKSTGISNYWNEISNKYEFVWTSATTIKKSVTSKVGLFKENELIGQDLHFFSKIAQYNNQVAYSTDLCVRYNRMAENNARTRIKVAHAPAYMNILQKEMEDRDKSQETINNIHIKYDRKMMAYIFTLILSGKSKEAKEVLNDWNVNKINRVYKKILYFTLFLPKYFLQSVYNIRLKVF